MPTGDTIVAIASPPGRSTRGMIRLSGPATREVLAAVLVGPPRPFERGCFRSRLRIGGRTLPALVATYRGPSSYTGEDSAELLLPGNPVLLERVLQALLSMPTVRQAGPGEFTARAYLNERLTFSEAEGVAATIAAEGEAQLAGARALLDGRMGAAYRAWAEEVATVLTLVEAGIDFTDQEDVVAISASELTERVASLIGRIEEYVGAGAGAGVRSETPRVVIAGKPNAGKSTLFNVLLGRRRAVVSEVAGTTRDVLEESLDLSRDLPGAGCVTLMDLAGLDADAAGIDAAAQVAAEHAIAEADAVLHCDPSGVFGSLPVGPSKPVIRVRTKGDLLAGDVDADAISVCALDGWNLPVLRRAIADVTTGSTGGSAAAVLPRHRRALEVARASLSDAMDAGGPELAAAGLRGALDALGELVGRISPDDVIGRIFATFCVGK